MQGFFCLVLHAHLPFVRHPEYEEFLEEDWLFEAMTETYIPILDMFDRLVGDAASGAFRVVMSISPSLCAMLSDELLITRYKRYLDKRIELVEKELIRTKNDKKVYAVNRMYHSNLTRVKYVFEDKYDSFILNGFKRFQELRNLELITTCATHGFLPFMLNKKNIEAQVKIGCEEFSRYFGSTPRGFWLPECAYTKDIEKILEANNIDFFFLDSHSIMLGNPLPISGVYRPVVCDGSRVKVFGRDTKSSREIWSKDEGYPGDPNYREFYRDLGFDAEYRYIKPYLGSDGKRKNLGLKYHRITGKVDLKEKKIYEPEAAEKIARLHAAHFVDNKKAQVKFLAQDIENPVIVAAYDAELFGHWWYEGPLFLEEVFKKMYKAKDSIKMVTASEYLAHDSSMDSHLILESSWGAKGFYDIWLNKKNDWIYRELHKLSELMGELSSKYPDAKGSMNRALNQAARELLLAESSDWAFILNAGTSTGYANKRLKTHVKRFLRLYKDIKNESVDEKNLADYERKNNIFPNIDYRVYG